MKKKVKNAEAFKHLLAEQPFLSSVAFSLLCAVRMELGKPVATFA